MELQQIIDKSHRIVFFGGAGVSTESGIPDFRSVDGLYNQKYDYPPEQILSHTFFMRHTKAFYDFYRDKMLCLTAKPNKAHYKLAEMERAGILSSVITQNIDGLHTAAGSKKVLELHGSVHRNYCMDCGKFYTAEDILNSTGIPKCTCGGTIKPDVVLYDVLGDVVCGGFAAPIREGYASKVLIVTSGEKMALYAANNINSAVKNFADRSYAKVRGIVMNRRNVEGEEEKVRAFAESAGLDIVADIPRSDDIIRCEDKGMTVIEGEPDCQAAKCFLKLAQTLMQEDNDD